MLIRACMGVTLASALLTGLSLPAEEHEAAAPVPFPGASQDPSPELALSQAIQIALRSNRTVNIAQLGITKAKWQVAATKTKRFPEISTDFFGSKNLNSPSFTFKKGLFDNANGNTVPSKDVTVDLAKGFTGYAIAQVAQPITQLYQINLAVKEQELDTDLARQQYEAKRQSIVADVKQAYYGALQTEDALHAAHAMVLQYEETDRVVLQYVAQESVLKSSSIEVKAKLAQAQYQVIQLSDTLRTQKEQLNELLGRDLDTAFHTQPIPPVSAEEMDWKLARQTALQQRPEVKEAEIDSQRAEYDRRLARSAYIPAVAAAFHYFSPIGTQILPENIASAGVEVKWDPFDWGKRRDDVKQKSVVVAQSKYQVDETRAQVLLDVDNTYRKLAESRALLNVAEVARDAAEEKMREVNDQFKVSVVLLRDVLEQQTALANANHQYDEGLLGFWSAKANFEKALGEE